MKIKVQIELDDKSEIEAHFAGEDVVKTWIEDVLMSHQYHILISDVPEIDDYDDLCYASSKESAAEVFASRTGTQDYLPSELVKFIQKI